MSFNNRCKNCKYYEVIFSPVLKRRVPACCMPNDTKKVCEYCPKSKK